jgi:type IV pilus assembly protein PilV
MKPISRKNQQGVFLLEALIGIIIFSIGILTMIALQTTAISVQSDAQYRIEAANLANRMLGDIVLSVNRDGANQTAQTANVQASLLAFVHQPTESPYCTFTGTDAALTNPTVAAWVTAMNTTPATRLPGTSTAMQQILVNADTANNFNQVTITICWQTAADARPRRHRLVSYIN